jgi:hypothetical protein
MKLCTLPLLAGDNVTQQTVSPGTGSRLSICRCAFVGSLVTVRFDALEDVNEGAERSWSLVSARAAHLAVVHEPG